MRGFSIVRVFACACALLLIGSIVRADSITLTLSAQVGSYGSLNPPDPTGPWATATFTQIDNHTVTLDLHALSALGSSFISSWGFNSSVPVSDLTITPDAPTAVKIAGLLSPDTFFEPLSQPVYSFGFSFNDFTFEINPPYYFGLYYLPNDPFFTITSTDNISAATFNVPTPQASLITEALIKDSNGGVWGAAPGLSGGPLDPPSAPAPNAAIAGLMILTGLAGWNCLNRRRVAVVA